jgi:hypothetical protein
MRRQQVCFELGITRHTLRRLVARDPTFPPFFEITEGIEVIDRRDFDAWIRDKRLRSRARALIDPRFTQDAQASQLPGAAAAAEPSGPVSTR